jgi:hypothetical protein
MRYSMVAYSMYRHRNRTYIPRPLEGDSGSAIDAAKPVDARVMDEADELDASTQEEIARLAYSYWEARGGHGGSPLEDWLRAEEELRRKTE